jgi:integrase
VHLAAITRIVLNTGIRPPKEVLTMKKEHVNSGDVARYVTVDQRDVLLPSKSVLVAKGKDGKPRVVPLNLTAQNVFRILVEDSTTGEWLFTNRKGEPIKARPYDLRHTFATRLVERGVHHFVISALLGHATPIAGFGYASRMTPGYAHATWEAMVDAVKTLDLPIAPPETANDQPEAQIQHLRKIS